MLLLYLHRYVYGDISIKKKKADVKGGTDLDDYDYGEEDEREYERDELDSEKD